jgi:hypothetical protein
MKKEGKHYMVINGNICNVILSIVLMEILKHKILDIVKTKEEKKQKLKNMLK